ncbi:DEAD/DEAH box helicase [Poseidonia sp.]|uniref:DEAD/DEAH box helicase n=1 Tax=Poseidonia sp. TaxID=2666344 RepID=UPI003F6A4228
MGSFQDLGISDALAEVLSSQGINEPFEVQVESIPPAMEGKDVSCRAPTGSGKTLAFGLPMLEKVSYAEPNRPRALILTPTRELAEQIYGVLKPLARVIDRTVGTIYGGVSYKNQYRALERGLDVVVACPGRLLDLMERGAVVLKDVEVVVIDEADRMADMGFMEPVCDILDRCLPDRQTVLFSATLDDEVADLIKRYQREPVRLEVGAEEVSITDMEHHFWLMPHAKKSPISAELIRNCGRTVVFCRTRLGVERVTDELLDDGLGVRGLHGGLSQRQRDRAMQAFKHGECMALVATDVAARGLDVEGVNCVIHYDPPENGKAYKHRSGRTARGGASGVVVSLVQRPQKKMYHRLQKNVGVNVDFTPPDFGSLPTFEVEYIPPEPRSRGRRDGGRRDGGRRDGGRRDGGGGYGRRDGGRRDGGRRDGGGGYGRRDGGRRDGGRRDGGGGGGYGRRDGGRRDGGRPDYNRNERNQRDGGYRRGDDRGNDGGSRNDSRGQRDDRQGGNQRSDNYRGNDRGDRQGGRDGGRGYNQGGDDRRENRGDRQGGRDGGRRGEPRENSGYHGRSAPSRENNSRSDESGENKEHKGKRAPPPRPRSGPRPSRTNFARRRGSPPRSFKRKK